MHASPPVCAHSNATIKALTYAKGALACAQSYQGGEAEWRQGALDAARRIGWREGSPPVFLVLLVAPWQLTAAGRLLQEWRAEGGLPILALHAPVLPVLALCGVPHPIVIIMLTCYYMYINYLS
jgi:hypothetical protein